jgi:hypothetical protein
VPRSGVGGTIVSDFVVVVVNDDVLAADLIAHKNAI